MASETSLGTRPDPGSEDQVEAAVKWQFIRCGQSRKEQEDGPPDPASQVLTGASQLHRKDRSERGEEEQGHVVLVQLCSGPSLFQACLHQVLLALGELLWLERAIVVPLME